MLKLFRESEDRLSDLAFHKAGYDMLFNILDINRIPRQLVERNGYTKTDRQLIILRTEENQLKEGSRILGSLDKLVRNLLGLLYDARKSTHDFGFQSNSRGATLLATELVVGANFPRISLIDFFVRRGREFSLEQLKVIYFLLYAPLVDQKSGQPAGVKLTGEDAYHACRVLWGFTASAADKEARFPKLPSVKYIPQLVVGVEADNYIDNNTGEPVAGRKVVIRATHAIVGMMFGRHGQSVRTLNNLLKPHGIAMAIDPNAVDEIDKPKADSLEHVLGELAEEKPASEEIASTVVVGDEQLNCNDQVVDKVAVGA